MFTKSQFISGLFSLCLIFSITACKDQLKLNTKSNGAQATSAEEIKEISENATEKKYSPDRRLQVAYYFTDEEKKNYRLTVVDNEQQKVIFSREFAVADETVKAKQNEKAISIDLILDNLLLVSQLEGSDKKKFLLIEPDESQIHELKCPGFSEADTKIAELKLENNEYKCVGKQNGESNQISEAFFPLPKLVSATSSAQKIQSKEFANLKVELSPFDETLGLSIAGQRASLKVFKDNKLIYQKNFSGKCSGCQWINQENWQEAFRIEQIADDKVLLTQVLVELNDDRQPKAPIYNSFLIIPSKKKMINLDCKESSDESAYVAKLDEKTFECKYPNIAEKKSVLTLPEV